MNVCACVCACALAHVCLLLSVCIRRSPPLCILYLVSPSVARVARASVHWWCGKELYVMQSSGSPGVVGLGQGTLCNAAAPGRSFTPEPKKWDSFSSRSRVMPNGETRSSFSTRPQGSLQATRQPDVTPDPCLTMP